MKIKSSIILLLICVIPAQLLVAGAIVIKELDVPPLRMTISELDSILNQARDLIISANGDKEEHPREQITLSHDGSSIRLEQWHTLTEDKTIPKYINSVRYSYLGEPGLPVASLDIILDGSYRRISLEGADKAQIYSLSTYLENELSKHSNFLATWHFKFISAVALVIFGAFIGSIGRRGKDSPLSYLNHIGYFVMLTPFVLPWGQWLPSVAIFTGSSSYIDRHINHIAVIGLLIGIASLIVAAMKSNNAPKPTQ